MSATTPTTTQAWINLLRSRINAVQTGTAAQEAGRLRALREAQAGAIPFWATHQSDRGAANLRSLAILAPRAGSRGGVAGERVAGKGASATQVQSATGTGSKTPARSGSRSGGGGASSGGGSEERGDIQDELDSIVNRSSTSVFGAIAQTIRGGGNTGAIWNPPGVGFFSRPSTKLILVSTTVLTVSTIVILALTAKPAPKKKEAQ